MEIGYGKKRNLGYSRRISGMSFREHDITFWIPSIRVQGHRVPPVIARHTGDCILPFSRSSNSTNHHCLYNLPLRDKECVMSNKNGTFWK
jgi:hypothetical protein